MQNASKTRSSGALRLGVSEFGMIAKWVVFLTDFLTDFLLTEAMTE